MEMEKYYHLNRSPTDNDSVTTTTRTVSHYSNGGFGMSIHQALHELTPNACWCMNGAQTYDNLQWNSDDIEKPSEEDVNAKIAEIEAAYPLKYLREREMLC